MTNIRKLTVLLAVAFASMTATAGAQSPTDSVYAPDSGVADVVESSTPTPQPEQEAAPEQESEAAPETPAPAQETPSTSAAPESTPTTTEQVQQSGELPFTGMEAGFVGLLGLALLGGGMLMRRLSRNDA